MKPKPKVKNSRDQRNEMRQRSGAAPPSMPSNHDNTAAAGPIFFWRETEEPYDFMCQWYASKFQDLNIHSDHVFSCAKQHMMYRKALLLATPDIESPEKHSKGKAGSSKAFTRPAEGSRSATSGLPAMILAEQKPGRQKELARSVPLTPQQYKKWESIKFDVVVQASYCKYSQNPVLRQRLFDTGDRELVEASPADKIWGIGFAAEFAELHRQDWGSNLLGKALQNVRARLKDELHETADGAGIKATESES